jgi:hypothetical protein
VLGSRKLIVAATSAVLTVGLAAIPDASADACTVSVTMLGGQKLTFPVNVAPGTPVSSLSLPIEGVIVSETLNCAPASTSNSSTTGSATTGASTTGSSTTGASTTGSSTTGSSTTGSSTTGSSTTGSSTTGSAPTPSSSSSSSTTSTSSTSSTASSSSSSSTSTTSTGATHAPPHPSGPPSDQPTSSHSGGPTPIAPGAGQKTKPKPKTKPKSKSKAKSKSTSDKLPTGKGVPSATNPTFSLSLPGPAPIGVPNFFIDSFRIPPFLLPIYQAAGIQYDVPWQVLAAINEIETDYGRNLSVSSAGAVGWMQFLPSTWKTWGVDANGDGVADPYNPVDAIFAAARYLHAAGASKNLSGAIFAYNHATWYVQSVLLRAKLIGGMPRALIGALISLVEGHFPVAAAAKYADDSVVRRARLRVTGSNAAIPIESDPNAKGTAIFAKRNSPVITANDGKIIKIGANQTLGRYLELQDATGNIYTYAQLGSVVRTYPVPKPVQLTAKDVAAETATSSTRGAPSAAATAGSQPTPAVSAAGTTTPASGNAVAHGAKPSSRAAIKLPSTSAPAPSPSTAAPMVKERLFADPSRAGSYAAGGDLQLQSTAQQISSFQNYFSDVLHLKRNQYTLKSLKVGSIVVGGTILGRIGASTPKLASHMYFMIQPAGKNAPHIDPKPVLDGWKLLEATAEYRADGVDPFFGPGAKDATVGQVLLMSKAQLTTRILEDPHVQIYPCGRRDIAAGLIDRRILATIEFLSASGLDPYVSGLECGHSLTGSTGTDAAGASGASVDISKINDIPVLGHQQPGSITDETIRRLLTLQGAMQPDQIISTIAYKGQSNTLALPDHQNRIQITFTPEFGANKKLSGEIKSILRPGQWVQLINRISQIPEPIVPIAPSKYAIRSHGG